MSPVIEQSIAIPTVHAEWIASTYNVLTSKPSLVLLTIFFFLLVLSIKGIRQKQPLSIIAKSAVSRQSLLVLVFCIYLVLLTELTVLPTVTYHAPSGHYPDHLLVIWIFLNGESTKVNLVPFITIVGLFEHGIFNALYNSIGNLLMLSPFGFLAPRIWKKLNLGKVTLWGFGISFLIEFFQYFQDRAVDIDDLLLNTLGATLGYLAFKIIKRRSYNANSRIS